jgi:hypothetical protein
MVSKWCNQGGLSASSAPGREQCFHRFLTWIRLIYYSSFEISSFYILIACFWTWIRWISVPSSSLCMIRSWVPLSLTKYSSFFLGGPNILASWPDPYSNGSYDGQICTLCKLIPHFRSRFTWTPEFWGSNSNRRKDHEVVCVKQKPAKRALFFKNCVKHIFDWSTAHT